MARKEVFTCDYCNLQSPSFSEGSGIPFNLGWRVLNSFDFKASHQYKHETIMKHFCSNHCLLAHVQTFIQEQEQNLVSKGKEAIVLKVPQSH
ncbi:MAG: hypothetical protein AABX11_01665 [Nanoarchaeota archaeon]